MAETFSYFGEPGREIGPTRETTVSGFTATPFSTTKRLVDGAIWIDRTKTGNQDMAEGWYVLNDEKTDYIKTKDLPDIPSVKRVAAPGTKIETMMREGDGAIFLDPRFFGENGNRVVPKPGWYRSDGGRFVEAPVEQNGAVAAWGALKHGMGSLVDSAAGNISAELDRRKRLIADHGLAGVALGMVDGNVRLVQGAGSKVLDTGQGFRAVGNKAMGSAGDKIQQRVAQIQMRDDYMPGRDFEGDAKLELQHEDLAAALKEATLDFGMFARNGDIIKADGQVLALTPDAQKAMDRINELVPAEARARARLSASVGNIFQGIHKEEMKGAGNMGAEVMDLVLSTLAMEATGGLSVAAKGASTAGKRVMGGLVKMGVSEATAAKVGRLLAAEVPTILEATAKGAGKGGILNPGNVAAAIKKTTADQAAGVFKRTAAHAGQGLAMGIPGSAHQFAQLYAGDENRTAASAFWETLMSQPHTAAVMVPMLSHRLRGKTMPFDKTSITGATKNAALRTGVLAGSSVLADLVASGGDPESIGSLPSHIKGLLGLELWGAYRGVGGAREAARGAALSQARGEGAVKVFGEDRVNLEAAHKTATEALGKLRATEGVAPEEVQMAEEVVAELKTNLDEASAAEQIGLLRKKAGEETAKALGIPSEKLQERVEAFSAKPKPAVADPVSGLMGPESKPAETPAPAPEPAKPAAAGPKMTHQEQAILTLLDQATVTRAEIKQETTRLNELVASRAGEPELEAQRKLIAEKQAELDATNEEIAFRRETTKSTKQNLLMGEDPFLEEDVAPSEGLDNPHLQAISKTMDHRGLADRAGLLRQIRATREQVSGQVDRARLNRAATRLLSAYNRGEAVDPGVFKLLEAAAPEARLEALREYLADKPALTRSFGGDHGEQARHQDAVALEAIQRALNEQGLSKSGISFGEALSEVWGMSKRRAEANKARGIGEPVTDTFESFDALVKHVAGMTSDLGSYLGEVDGALPGHMDKAIKDLEGRQASLDRMMGGVVDPRAVQGLQLTAKSRAEHLDRMKKLRASLETESPDPAVSRGYSSVTSDWLEGIRLKGDQNQAKTVRSPFGGKLDGYRVVMDKTAGIYRVHRVGTDGAEPDPLARPAEMERATRPGSMTDAQLRALWDVDHTEGVAFGEKTKGGSPAEGFRFNWKVRGGALVAEPKPTAMTTEFVKKGENGALADAEAEVSHYDMVRFTEEVNALLRSRNAEPIEGARRPAKLSPEELKAKAEQERLEEEARQKEGRRVTTENIQAQIKDRAEQMGQIAKRGETVAPENDRTAEIVREISRHGAGALALNEEALYNLIRDKGASVTQRELDAGKIQGDPAGVLSARELQALSYLWEQAEVVEGTERPATRIPFRMGVGEQVGRQAGIGTDPRDISRDRDTELRGKVAETTFANGRGREELADRKTEAWRELQAQRKIAGRALAKLYRAGVIPEDAFVLPGENPHEQGVSDAGNPMTHRNAGHRRILESALERAVEDVGGSAFASDAAEALRYSFLEHRQMDSETEALLKNHGGRWTPNRLGAEASDIYLQEAARKDLPAPGDPSYQEHLDALGQNPHLRASMQRIMAYENLLRMADAARKMAEGTPEERNAMADAILAQAERVANAGDLALHAHIRSTTGSYFKPILEPYTEPAGEGVRAGFRAKLAAEDLVALVNPNHHRHQEMLNAFEGGLEPGNLWRTAEDARSEDPNPLDAVTSRAIPVATAAHRAKGGEAMTAKVAESIMLDDARMTALGEMNHRDRVAKEVKHWLNSGNAALMRLGSQWNKNKAVLLEAAGGDKTEAGRVILDVADKMDPQLFATLKLESTNQWINGDFNPATDVLRLGARFTEMAKDKYQSHKSISTFFHEMTHFLTSYMDPEFRARTVQRYQDHMERATSEDPVMRAIYGKGSPVDWMTLGQDYLYQNRDGRRVMRISEEDAAEIVARAQTDAPAILEALSGWPGFKDYRGIAPKEAVEMVLRDHVLKQVKGGVELDFTGLATRGRGMKDRLYRFSNPDEYLAEAFGNFAMFAGTNGRVADQHKEAFDALVGSGPDRVETVADMLAMLKTYRAMKPGSRPTGGGNLDLVSDLLGILRAGDAAPAAGAARDKSRLTSAPPKKPGVTDALLEEDISPDGPTTSQLNGIRDQLEVADRLMVRAARKAGEAISPVARKAVELMAADAISPATRTFSHLHTWMDARYTAARAKDEQAADQARLSYEKAFRRETSDSFFKAAQTLLDSGRATDHAAENSMGIRLLSGKIGQDRAWINADKDGKVLQVMTDAQRQAYRYVESNGRLGGEGLNPELKAELDRWIDGETPGSGKGVKGELEAWRKDEMMRAPGIDPAMAESMWVRDYLAHLYPHAKGGRTLDRILEDRDSIASLDRFQRRVYASYDQAFSRAGLLPRLSNPVDNYLLGAREGARVTQLRHAIGALEARGLAAWGYNSDPNFVRLELGPKGSMAMKRLGFKEAEAPKTEAEDVQGPMKDVWIHRDVEPLIRSAFDYGLSKTAFGGTFKGAMLVNHLLSPAKLALSGFHLGMISRLGSVEAMRSTWSNYQRLRRQGVDHEAAMARSFQATAGQALMFGAIENGKKWRQLFVDHGHKSPQELAALEGMSDLDKATLVMMQMGGYAPMLSPARETMEREDLKKAIFDQDAVKTVWKGYTAGMESLQDAIMNHTVAPAKTGHLVNDFQRKLRATYGDNLDFGQFTRDLFVNRQIEGAPYATTALGEYARHGVSMNDNTFGMTNYRRLMMNPILKDLMHAWNLSFGWRHGTMGIAFKALDDMANRAPGVGGAYQGFKKGMGGTGIDMPVDGRDNVRFMVTHGMTDILLTLTLGALGVAQFPNWKKKKDEDGKELPEDLDLHALRGRLEDLVFPVLSDRLNHNSMQNRYATGYAYDFWAGIKNPGKWLLGHTEANSPLVSTGTAFLTGKDAIGNEIGNPYGMMPKEWADRVATWMADPESSAFLTGLAKRGLQVPREFVPISATTLHRLVKTGEDPKVALFTLAGLRKLPDSKGFGQTDMVQAAMEMRSKSGSARGDGRDAGEQEKALLRNDLVADALNTRDAEPLQGLVGQGYTQGGVQKMTDGLFREVDEKGKSKVRSAAERLFKGASFEDQLALAELARRDEAEAILPILMQNATKGLARLEEANATNGARARMRYEAILRRWGVEP